MNSPDILKSLARLMQQTAVKQAMQECALRRLLALVPPDRTAALGEALRADAQQVMENFGAGIDQPTIDSTIALELNLMLEALSQAARR